MMTGELFAVTYLGDAETRGRLRVWKKQLAAHYSQVSTAYAALSNGKMQSVPFDLVKKRRVKREKALRIIRRALGPGATFETTYSNGKMALFSALKSRDSVAYKVPENVPESERASLLQDCVTVNYFVVGLLPGFDRPDRVGVTEGLWTLEVPDHALGRAVERSRFLHPGTIIREAHLNLLELPSATTNLFRDKEQYAYIKAGPGCFVGTMRVSPDRSLQFQFSVHVRVATWLDENQLGDDQIPLQGKGQPGDRLGDSWLAPAPLRQIVETEPGKLEVFAWQGKK